MKTGCVRWAVIIAVLAWKAQAAPRIALMDFSTDDNSYRSAQVAADFTAILQVQLDKEPGVEWVDRAQLDKARQEIEMSAMELAGNNSPIQRGKWVKADWTITGQFSSDDRNQLTLSLEVTDLKHADALASKTITFPGTSTSQFQISTNQVSLTTEALHELLSEAQTRERQSSGKILVAPLFLADVTGMNAGFSFLRNKISYEQELNEALERAMATNDRVRLIRFPKAYRSLEESEMVLDGMVAADRNAWQQTADLYVWGYCEAKQKMSPGKPPEETVEITLHLWDGASQPAVVVEKLAGDAQPAQIEAGIERLANRVIDGTHQRATPVDSGAIRKSIAQSLVETYDRMTLKFHHRDELGLDEPEKFLQAAHMLETACFFDPDNANARVLYITCRWGWWMDFGFKVKNEFWSKWRRSEAMGRYVNRFGLKPVTEELPFPYQQDGGIPEMYLRSLEDVSEMFPQWHTTDELALEDQWRQQGVHTWLMEAEYHGFPKEMPHEVAWKWKNEMSAENCQRIFKVAEYLAENGMPQEKIPSAFLSNVIRRLLDADQEPAMRLSALETIWPLCVEYAQKNGKQWVMGAGELAVERELQLTDLCVQAGKPDRAGQLLAILSTNQPAVTAKANPDRSTAPMAQKNPLSRVPAPKWLTESHSIFSMFQLKPPTVLTAEVKPEFREIHFPSRFEIQSVLKMDFLKDDLLILAMDERSAQSSDANPGLSAEMLDKHNRLWLLKPGSTSPVLYESKLFPQNIQAFLLKDDRLWVAGKNTGYLDLQNRAFHKFGLKEGLAVEETCGIGAAGGGIFVCGDSFNAFKFESTSNRWSELPKPSGRYSWSSGEPFILTGTSHWLNVCQKENTILIYDLVANEWQNLSSASALQCSLAKDNGFWFGGRDGLTFYDPVGKSFKHWQAPAVIQGVMYSLMGSYSGNYQISQWELETLDGQIQGKIRKLAEDRAKVHAARLKNEDAADPLHLDWRIPGQVTALAMDGDFLWLGVGNYFGNYLLLLHMPSESLVATFTMPVRDAISSLALSKTSVWIGTAYGDHKLLEVPKESFLLVPRNQWVSLAISPEARTQLLRGMSVHDQAVYAFYAGDDAKVAALLGNIDPGKATLEEMFLLLFCSDSSGLNNPEMMQAWAEHIASRFPDTPWSRAAQAIASKKSETTQPP